MTELHRWHHSPDLAEGNHNYGGNLIVWDVVFGTRFLPPDREPPRTIGIGDMPAFPRGLLWQLAVPFRWARVREIVMGPDLAETGFFDMHALGRLVEQHQSGIRDHSTALWLLLMFGSFMRQIHRRGERIEEVEPQAALAG